LLVFVIFRLFLLPHVFSTEILVELLERPHISWDFVVYFYVVRPLLKMLGDRVICQVREEVLGAARVIVVAAES